MRRETCPTRRHFMRIECLSLPSCRLQTGGRHFLTPSRPRHRPKSPRDLGLFFRFSSLRSARAISCPNDSPPRGAPLRAFRLNLPQMGLQLSAFLPASATLTLEL